MSHFAAIEARATAYPASVNDVVWLVARVRQLRVVLTLAQHDMDIVSRDLAVATDVPGHLQLITAALDALDEPNRSPP